MATDQLDSEGAAAPATSTSVRSAADEPASDSASTKTKPRRWWRWALGLGLAPVVLLLLVYGVDRTIQAGEVMRGVSVGEVALAGKDHAATEQALGELEERLRTIPLPIRIAGKEFALEPEQVGFELDVGATVDAALAAGRTGGWFAQLRWWVAHWLEPQSIAPLATVDQAALEGLLSGWAEEAIEDPPFEGAIIVRNGQPAVDYPRPGQGVDRAASYEALRVALGSEQRAAVDIPLVQVQPRRDRKLLEDALQRAHQLVGSKVVLRYEPPAETTGDGKAKDGESKGPAGTKKNSGGKAGKAGKTDDAEDAASAWTTPYELPVTPSQLAEALRYKLGESDDLRVELLFDPEVVDTWLNEARKRIEHPPIDARFVVEKRDKVRIVPSRAGTLIDKEQVAAALLTVAQTPKRQGPLPIQFGAQPELTTEKAQELRIAGLVSKYTTVHPCCRPRVKNIHRIADMVDGTVVLPGETFSINKLIGPRTAKKGYLPAPTIVEGEMKDTIGGGISQFATTLFNAAFYGGYDVVSRAPHSYYFTRYPHGLDATLSFPKPDLKIRNDTKAGLLIKTEYSAGSITVKFYGDNEGRRVRAKKSATMDVVKPPVKLLPNPKLEPEDEELKKRGKIGWSLYVTRVITFADGKTKEQKRKVTYQPRPREVEVHPCRIPKGEEGYTGRPCPKKEEDEPDAGAPDEPGDEEPTDQPKPEPAPEPDEEPPPAGDLVPPDLIEDG